MKASIRRLPIGAILVAVVGALSAVSFEYYFHSQPGWSLSMSSVSSYRAFKNGKHNLLCALTNDERCANATACILQGSTLIDNIGNRPLALLQTAIHVYLIPRADTVSFAEGVSIADASPSHYFGRACKHVNDGCNFRQENALKTDEPGCISPIETICVGPIDDHPLYPSQRGTRLFAFELGTLDANGESMCTNSMSGDKAAECLEKIAEDNVVVLRAYQELETQNRIFNNELKLASSASMIPDICGFRTKPLKDNRDLTGI